MYCFIGKSSKRLSFDYILNYTLNKNQSNKQALLALRQYFINKTKNV